MLAWCKSLMDYCGLRAVLHPVFSKGVVLTTGLSAWQAYSRNHCSFPNSIFAIAAPGVDFPPGICPKMLASGQQSAVPIAAKKCEPPWASADRKSGLLSRVFELRLGLLFPAGFVASRPVQDVGYVYHSRASPRPNSSSIGSRLRR